jgi:hypothetical protein
MRRRAAGALCACLLLAAACGPGKEPVKQAGKEEAGGSARAAVDTSTAADWQANCALFQEYHDGLIFSAIETTTADGKRTVAWAAQDRARYLGVFLRLALDGVPELKLRRDRILEEAGKAPGGGSVAILPKLDGMVSALWKEIEAAAKKHGVSCRPQGSPSN